MTKEPPTSPRIERLANDLASGEVGALDMFWREVEASGAPIIEPINGDDHQVLATFVFRGDASTNGVALLGWVGGGTFSPLVRLAATDLFYRTAVVPAGVRSAYRFLPNPPAADIYDIPLDQWRALESDKRWTTDPLNSRAFQCGAYAPNESVIELPGADPQLWLAEGEGVPQGTVEPHRFESEILGGARIVWTYAPPGYDADAGPYPVAVFYDGYGYVHMDTPRTLDNLIAAGLIPPIVCAFVQPADRMVELACDESFARAMAVDLMRSWLPGRLRVTGDPARTVIGGVSLGGLAAAFAALRHPNVFGNFISQSGSFWWGPGTTMPADMTVPGIEWEWLTKEASKPASRRLRAHIEVGVLETSPVGGRMPDMIEPNRRMRDALAAAGHDVVKYREFNGGHDFVCWRGSIADALIALAGRWVA